MAVVRWNPWSDVFALHEQMDSLLGEAFGSAGAAPSTSQRGAVTMLPVDIRQSDEAFFIEASVPGLSPEDVEVTFDEGVLTIQGTRTEARDQERAGYVRRERQLSSVYRQISLPAEVRSEEISASFEHGVLTITVPRSQKAQPRRITVNAATAESPQLLDDGAPAADEVGAAS